MGFILTLILLLLAQAALGSGLVNRIIDGDTFVLDFGEKVCLIGVDCPETHDPNKPVEHFSAEAT